MKKMKRLASLVLAMAMVLTMGISAFADDPTGTITVSNPISGQTYKAIKLFDVEYNETTNAFVYKSDSAIPTGLTDYFERDAATGVVTVKDAAKGTDNQLTAAAVAALQAWAVGKDAADSKTAAEGATSVTLNVPYGYYVVTTTTGAAISVDSANKNGTVNEKNEVPESDKEVQEDSTSQWGTENDADVGQTVNYRSTIDVKNGAVNYKFIDTMTTGLTLCAAGDIKVQYDNNGVMTDLPAADYTVNRVDDQHFNIVFTNDTVGANPADHIGKYVDKTLTITYSAVLNENAILTEKETNTAKLEYGNKPENERDTTPPSTTETYTWEFNIFKYYLSGTTKTRLAGATFQLSKSADNASPIGLIKVSDTLYRVAKSDETTDTKYTTDIVTVASGDIKIDGLDSDTYYLTETAAPAGYNKLTSAISFTIDNKGNVKQGESTLANKTIEIENNTGVEMPTTGGVGTTIFYIVGTILVLAAGVLLITKRRMQA